MTIHPGKYLKPLSPQRCFKIQRVPFRDKISSTSLPVLWQTRTGWQRSLLLLVSFSWLLVHSLAVSVADKIRGIASNLLTASLPGRFGNIDTTLQSVNLSSFSLLPNRPGSLEMKIIISTSLIVLTPFYNQ